MAVKLQVGDEVGWKWAGGVATGFVIAIKPKPRKIESKATKVVRNGTKDNPAVLIAHKKTTTVLKLASELQRISAVH